MTWRHHRKCKVIERAIDKGGAELVEATGRALAPTAEAVRDIRQRRAAKKAAPRDIKSAS